MLGRLITLESYSNAMQATLAKNYLEAAGIQCALADEHAASNLWHLSGAIGGIKLQVAESDLERAADLLEEIENQHRRSAAATDELSPGEDSGEVAADEQRLDDEPKPKADDDSDDEPALNAREENVERAYRAVLVGYIPLVFPIQFYALWLLLEVWQSDLPLRPAVRRKLNWAIALHLPILLGVLGMIFLILFVPMIRD